MDKLVKMLQLRLQSVGEVIAHDASGSERVVKKDIFGDEQLRLALKMSISMLNLLLGTEMSDEDYGDQGCQLQKKYSDLIVQGAALYLLSGHALTEKGREYTLKDQGTSYDPPAISNTLMEQWKFEYEMYMNKIQIILYNREPK